MQSNDGAHPNVEPTRFGVYGHRIVDPRASDSPRKTKVKLMDVWFRVSTISPSQLAIRIKIIYCCLVGGERRREKRSGLLCKSQL